MRALRLLRIVDTIGRFGLDEFLPRRGVVARAFFGALRFWRPAAGPRGERLRLALESLGPVFVKFGQLLSVRRDMIPEDIADELAKLQDRVPPFPLEQVLATLPPSVLAQLPSLVLARLPLSALDKLPPSVLVMAWHAGARLTKPAQAFVQHCQAAIGGLKPRD